MSSPVPCPELSIVIPFLNEEQGLPLLRRSLAALSELPEGWELVFVSDGSTDGSVPMIEEWASQDKRVKLVVFTRNFGHQSAICAGLDFAAGRYVGIMDADLQDPPEVLLQMYREACQGGWDVVYHARVRRQGSWLKRLGYRAFYSLYRLLAESPVAADSGDFCVLSRRAVEALRALPERVRFVRGLRSWLGLRSKAFPASRPDRAAGKAQYSWARLLALALNGLTSFSARPLRLATLSGFLLCSLAMGLACVYLSLWLFFGIHQKAPGFTTIVLLLLFLNGLQFLMLGIIGEYVGQTFLEVKARPTYLVDRTVNLEMAAPLEPSSRKQP